MMTERTANLDKISPEFATRLARLQPQQKVRVIVLLQAKKAETLTGKRQSHVERKAAMQTLRESAEQALAKIAGIIQQFEEKLLADHPDLLGSMPIEITAAGVHALAKSDAVKAIIEDQEIYRLERNLV